MININIMKKKIVVFTKTLIIIIVLGVSLFSTQKSKSESLTLLMRNVEALATEETSSGGCKWKNIQCPWPVNKGYGVCITNGDGSSCSCGATTYDPLPC